MKIYRVEEKLPPCGVDVLAYRHWLDQEYGEDGYFGPYFKVYEDWYISKLSFDNSWAGDGVVTHWMHKPKPPKG